MTKRRRKVLFIGGILLMLIVLGVGFLWWYFLSPERLRARVERELAKALNADVSVGAAQWRWFFTVTLSDVVVRERAEDETPVLKVPQLLANGSYWDLLRGRQAVRTVMLDGAKLNVALTPDFKWPFYDNLPKQKTPEQTPAVTISNGTVRVSMPDAPERFPAQEFSGIRVVMHRSGSADFDSSPGVLGRLHGAVKLNRSTGALGADIVLESMALTPALREHLPVAALETWDALSPEKGALQLKAQISRNAAPEQVLHYSATLSLRDGEFCPKGIPYAFEGMTLDAKVSDGKLEQFDLSGRTGDVALTGSGVGAFRAGKGFAGTFTANARGIALGRDISPALPEEARKIWDAMKPDGMADIGITAVVPDEGKPAVTVRATLRDVRVTPPAFPFDLAGVKGSVEWDLAGKRVSVSELTGRMGGAPFNVSPGYVALTEGGPLSLSLNVDNLLLDRPLREIAPGAGEGGKEQVRELLGPLRVRGAFDSALSLQREKQGEPLRLKCGITARDAALIHPEHGTVQNIAGDFSYEGTFGTDTGGVPVLSGWTLQLGQLKAVWRGARITVEPFRLSGPAGAGWTLKAHALDLPADDQLKALLPRTALPAWNRFSPSATADIDIVLSQQAGNKHVRTDMLAQVRECSTRYSVFPYPIQDAYGTFTVVDDQLGEAHIRGKNGLASVAVDATRTFDNERGEEYALLISASGMPLDQDLYGALPPDFKQFWDDFNISKGKFDTLDLDLHLFPQKGRPDRFRFSAGATLSGVAIEKSVPMFAEHGRISVEHAERDASGTVNAHGAFHFEQANVERSTMEDVTGHFRYTPDGLAIQNIVGGAYGGVVSGNMYAEGVPGSTERRFHGALTLRDANLSRILEAASPGMPEQELKGRLDASIDFSAPLTTAGEFEAVGGMTIRKGTIGKLPGFLSVLNLLVLDKIGAPVFTDMVMAYEMRGGAVLVHKLNLTGHFVSLEGTGSVQEDGALALAFVPRFGPDLPEIPWLSSALREVLKTIKEQSISINVRGSYNDPVWQINPLMPVTQLVQGIAGGLAPPKKTTGRE